MVNFVLKPPLLTDQTPYQLNPSRPWNQIGSIPEGRRLSVPRNPWYGTGGRHHPIPRTPNLEFPASRFPPKRPQLSGPSTLKQYSPKVINISTTGQATVNPLTQFVPGGEAEKYMSSITEFRDRPKGETAAGKKVPPKETKQQFQLTDNQKRAAKLRTALADLKKRNTRMGLPFNPKVWDRNMLPTGGPIQRQLDRRKF